VGGREIEKVRKKVQSKRLEEGTFDRRERF
jgi:hypothetical protein